MAALAAPAGANVDEGWIVKITTATGDYRSIITLGSFADASDSYDVKYDAPVYSSSLTPPPISARFPHPEWGLTDTHYLYDIRAIAANQQWSFETESEFFGRDVSLEWNLAELPADYALTLTDVTTGQSIDMSSQARYSFPNTGPRSFTVAAVSAVGSNPPAPTDGGQTTGVTPLAAAGGGGGSLEGVTLLALLLAWPVIARRRTQTGCG